MQNQTNQQKPVIPYYTHWTIALNVLSVIIFILSICIAIPKTEKETKAELLISYIILSSCMFIGTIPFIIKTVKDKHKGLLALYIFILLFSTVNLVLSGILLNKLKKEEEEEEIKNYSGALIFLSLLFLVLYVVSSIFEYKKEKEYVYQPGEAFRKAAADRLERYRVYNMIKKDIMNKQGGSQLSRNDLDRLVRTKMNRYDAKKKEITSKSKYPYPSQVLSRLVIRKLNQQQLQKKTIKDQMIASNNNLSPENLQEAVNQQYRRRKDQAEHQRERLQEQQRERKHAERLQKQQIRRNLLNNYTENELSPTTEQINTAVNRQYDIINLRKN